MKLFPKKVHPWQAVWRYEVNGFLWLFRMAGDRIVGEARRPERNTATFFCLEERTGRPLWEDLAFDEPWWVGIEDVRGGAVYFHRYRQPNMPQHRGVMRVDIETGALAWDHPDDAYVAAEDGRVIVARERFEGFHYAALDAATGRLRDGDPVDAAAAHAARARSDDPAAFAGCAYPEPLDPAVPAHAAMARWLAPHLPARPTGDIELLARGDVGLATWHCAGEASRAGEADPAAIDQHVLALDMRDGSLLFTERVNSALRQPMIDSFMTKDDLLLFVSERRTLTAYSLQQALR